MQISTNIIKSMNENIETWADIDGYEKLYQVSTLGRVRSLDRLVRNGNGYRLRKGRILKPQLNGSGYQQVHLSKDGNAKNYQVHQLVAQAFIPNPLQLPQVNHINENKVDNRVENLEWCDRSYNCNFGTRNVRLAKALKGKPNIALSKRVAQINPQTNEVIKIWSSTAECQRHGYNQGHIAECCQGKRKTHHSYKWKYIDDSI